MTCVCRAKVHHQGNQHPFVHTSHIFKNNFIYLDFFYLFFIYFLQYCVGFCCTTVLILFIFVCTGPSLQCMGVFLLRSTGSSGQASAAAAPRLQSTGPIVMVHGLSCSTCGIFPDQGSNLCLLHWQVDSYTTEPAGNPISHI